jgi:hypothetical protein
VLTGVGVLVCGCSNLDSILQDLSKNFAEGTEYFHILVQVFQVRAERLCCGVFCVLCADPQTLRCVCGVCRACSVVKSTSTLRTSI